MAKSSKLNTKKVKRLMLGRGKSDESGKSSKSGFVTAVVRSALSGRYVSNGGMSMIGSLSDPSRGTQRGQMRTPQRIQVSAPKVHPSVRAVEDAGEALSPLGLRRISVTKLQNGGLSIVCTVDQAIEYEYQPTHDIGVGLMHAAVSAGSWVEELNFIPAHAQ